MKLRVATAPFLMPLIMFGLSIPAAWAQSEVSSYTASRINWKSLSYRASRLGVRVRSRIEMDLVPASDVTGSLLATDEGRTIDPRGEQVARITIVSTVRGRESTMVLSIDPVTAAAYQRTMLADRGNEYLFRTFRFLEDGVFIRRQIGPRDGQGPEADWPVSNERVLEHPEELGGNTVTEASALFYMLSAGDFREVGDQLTFYNFDRGGMSRVVLTVSELTQTDVDYIEISPDGERRIRETHPVARLTVSGDSVGQGDEAFSFLGLRGNIEIFADLVLRVPVAVRGRVPRAGNTTVRVREIVVG